MSNSLLAQLDTLLTEARQSIYCADEDTLCVLTSHYLGKEGAVSGLLKGLKEVGPSERSRVGMRFNDVRAAIEIAIASRRDELVRYSNILPPKKVSKGNLGSKLIWFGCLAVIAVLVVVLEIWSHTVIVVHP